MSMFNGMNVTIQMYPMCLIGETKKIFMQEMTIKYILLYSQQYSVNSPSPLNRDSHQ